MEIPFIGGSYQGYSKNLNSQICQNLYPVIDNQGGKSILAMEGIPGLTLVVNFETVLFYSYLLDESGEAILDEDGLGLNPEDV